MTNEELMEVLTTQPDGAIAIVTQGINEPHVVNSWNSYVNVTDEGDLLIPVGGMIETEKNIENNNMVKLTITNREVPGKMLCNGTGFLIKGTARFIKEDAEFIKVKAKFPWSRAVQDFDMMKAKFPWARAVLAITIESAERTL